jgi:hypothetical protein
MVSFSSRFIASADWVGWASLRVCLLISSFVLDTGALGVWRNRAFSFVLDCDDYDIRVDVDVFMFEIPNDFYF